MIVGHVDTKTGPSVFYNLGKLHPGDLIEVARADESVVVFRVDTVEHFPKDQLPAERIYGHDGPPGLRLITCGGQFIGGTHRLRRQRHRLRHPAVLPQVLIRRRPSAARRRPPADADRALPQDRLGFS